MSTSSELGHWRRWLVGLLVLGGVLLVQLPLVARSQPQPYPGIILPGFRETSDGSRLVRHHTEARVRFADGSVRGVELSDVFQGVRVSAIPPMTQVFVREDRRPPRTAVLWLQDRIADLFPGRQARAVEFCDSTVVMDLDRAEVASKTCDVRTVVRLA